MCPLVSLWLGSRWPGNCTLFARNDFSVLCSREYTRLGFSFSFDASSPAAFSECNNTGTCYQIGDDRHVQDQKWSESRVASKASKFCKTSSRCAMHGAWRIEEIRIAIALWHNHQVDTKFLNSSTLCLVQDRILDHPECCRPSWRDPRVALRLRMCLLHCCNLEPHREGRP